MSLHRIILTRFPLSSTPPVAKTIRQVDPSLEDELSRTRFGASPIPGYNGTVKWRRLGSELSSSQMNHISILPLHPVDTPALQVSTPNQGSHDSWGRTCDTRAISLILRNHPQSKQSLKEESSCRTTPFQPFRVGEGLERPIVVTPLCGPGTKLQCCLVETPPIMI
ncbi:hypothetical protein BDV12DRAFT_44923 [Aspergillus spectabilis]